jgi:PAS domain S-box-containing protein
VELTGIGVRVMLNKKNRKPPLHDILLTDLERSSNELFENFCKRLMEAYPLKGVALAIRNGDKFKVCCNRNLFSDTIRQEINFSEPDVYSFSDQDNDYNRKKFTFINDSDHRLLLIIEPIKKNKINIGDIREAADYLSKSVNMQKKQAEMLDKYRNYMSIFQKSSNLTAILNLRGEVIEWNEAAQQIYGRDLASGPVNYMDFINEEEIPRIRKLFANLYSNCQDYRASLDPKRLKNTPPYREAARGKLMEIGTHQGITKLTSRTGDRTLDVDYTVSLIFDSETLETTGCIVTTTDITNRKIMREQLEETERKYRELFKLIPLFTMLIDTSGATVDFNYTSLDDYGLDPRREGISYMDFIHEDDRKRAAAMFIDIYTNAVEIKNRWIKDKAITKEECALQLRALGIRNEPIRMVSQKRDKIFETEFNLSLWISETDLEIKGALLSAIDRTELNSYRRKLEESEKKYRELVEKKTRDIIFSLDNKARFVMVNSNIKEKLGYQEDAVIGKYIIDILYKDPAHNNQIDRETFLENLDRVFKAHVPDVRFKAVCDHKFLGEPVTLQFKLDPIMENGEVAGVMGFASEMSDDPLREYLQEESLSYAIDNRLTIADEASFRITRNLEKYLTYGKIGLFRLGIREMIVNAIEHGNLGITYEEKTRAQKNQTYHDLLQERQRSDENRLKKVYINYRLNDDRIEYTIRDEGSGFDYKKFLKFNVSKLNEQMIQHGRGILITRSIFDQIEYNDKGNEVNLYANLKKNTD